MDVSDSSCCKNNLIVSKHEIASVERILATKVSFESFSISISGIISIKFSLIYY